MSEKLTTWERLRNTLSPSAQRNQITKNIENNQEREILNASSREEAMVKNRERQQTTHLNSGIRSIFSQQKNKRIMYESDRLSQYMDYEAMDYYPIIGAALNLMSEECTTKGENGNMLNIYSSDNRVKKELENLFYKVLDINTVLPFWCRNLIKYGDNFVYLDLQETYGICGATQLPNLDIERIEDENEGQIKVKYINKQKRSHEFTPYQIGHFRLLGDDRRLPYGMSVLDKVRKVFKMLSMAEDGWLVYIITRVAERRIYKVDVGNSPVEDYQDIIDIVANQVKKTSMVDHNGQINFNYSIATQDSDLFIPVKNGNSASPVETLPGAQNTDKIEYILYLRDLLYTGLETPKSFLDFSSDSTGDGGGKNMSMTDIRFAKKINRIQQALVSELNKFAIIHLHLLGGDFARNLDNFTLTLTNPSTQAEMLKIELMNAKLDLYAKLTTPSDTGIKPYSEVRAKKEILNMSIDDIIEDLKDQFDELKIGDEIRGAGQLIKTSGLFDEFIKYMNSKALPNQETTNGAEGENQADSNVTVPTDDTLPPNPTTDGANKLNEDFIFQNKRVNDMLNDLTEEFKKDKSAIIAKEVKKNISIKDKVKLMDMGYSKADIEKMKTSDLRKIINESKSI